MCIFSFWGLGTLSDDLQGLQISEVRCEICGENHLGDEVLDVRAFVGGVALEEVYLAVLPQNGPELVEMHLLQY